MNKHMRNTLVALAGLMGMSNLWASDMIKANNASNLNLPAAWVGGVVPGNNDVAQWNSTVTAANTVLLGADTSWAGAKILSPGGGVQINAGATLTLGAAGVDMSTANNNFTLNCALTIGADQSWHAGSKQFSAWGPAVNMGGHQVTILAGSKIQFKSAILGGGTLIANGGVTQLSSGTTASNTTVVVGAGATLTFDTASGAVTGIRAQNAKLNGGTLSVSANTSMNTIDYVSNALTIDSRLSTLTITSAINRNTQLRAGSYVRNPGALAIFAGLNLGLNPIVSAMTNSTSIWFDTPPTLLGGGGGVGTTTNSILVGMVPDTTAGGYGMGFGTYDAAYGVRALDLATEYTNSITDGQPSLDNVRYGNTGSGQMVTTLIAPLTTINSLIMTEAGASNTCGIAIYAAPSSTLKINSGMIFANQSMPAYPSTNDALVLTVPILDFNGTDGVIYVRETKFMSNGSCPAPFHFRSSPTNVSENGISFYAPQGVYVYFDGTQTNTYKGKVTINRNLYVRMIKTVSNNAILGPLVINGGTCQFNNQIADDVDIVMNSGSVLIKTGASNSGDGGSETIRDLTMYDGTYTHGGGAGGTVIMRKLGLLGGILNPTRSTRTTVSNDMVIAGGQLNISGNTDSTRSGPIVYVYGTTTISNTLSTTQYNPITLGYSWYRNAAAVTLTNRLSVYGNNINTNSVIVTRTYNTDIKTMLGEFCLSGPVEFNIDDGVAVNDFEVDASIANNGSLVGSLIKTGVGTLLLTAPTNSITGGIDVNEGRLILNGIVSNDVAVASGATFAGTGIVRVISGTALVVDANGIVNPGTFAGSVGTLSATGNVTFASASIFHVDINGSSADCLVASGNVSGGSVVLDVSRTGSANGPWLIMQANQITGTYTVQGDKLMTVTKEIGTELWLVKNQGTVISFQ